MTDTFDSPTLHFFDLFKKQNVFFKMFSLNSFLEMKDESANSCVLVQEVTADCWAGNFHFVERRPVDLYEMFCSNENSNEIITCFWS